MLDFMTPKTKLRAYTIQRVPIEGFQITGIGQINPYCNLKFENEVFVTIVDITFDSRKYDEKEGMVLTKYFTVRRCPECKQIELIPVKLRINRDSGYLKHEEDIAFDDFEERSSRRYFPTVIEAYCNNCSSCFQIRIKNNDPWVKEALKLKERDLITGAWEEYYLD